MGARIFQAFKKVWTPRTPDSGYDSLGLSPPPQPIVRTSTIADKMGSGVTLASAAYYAASAIVSSSEVMGSGITLVSATYTAPP